MFLCSFCGVVCACFVSVELGGCLFYRERDYGKGCLNLVKRCVRSLAILLFLYKLYVFLFHLFNIV